MAVEDDGTVRSGHSNGVEPLGEVVVVLLPAVHVTAPPARSAVPTMVVGLDVQACGGHLVAEDLIDVLDSGHLAHAYLDVFEHEPLTHDHPLWTHPGITITPHSAALTEPRTAIPKIVENIERLRRGQPPHNLVDFDAGY